MCSNQCGRGLKRRKIICNKDIKTDNCPHYLEELKECTSKELCSLGKQPSILLDLEVTTFNVE